MKKVIYIAAILMSFLSISCKDGGKIPRYANSPVMKFESNVHDFGTITEGDKVETEFVFNGSDTLYVKCKESWDTCWEKTLMAFCYFMPFVDKYDFIYRTNLSSFIHFGRYLRFCGGLPASGVYSGFIGKHGEVVYASGSGFTLSIDMFKKVVEAGTNQKKLVQDDVTVGAILNKDNLTSAKRINWSDIMLLDTDLELFHVRLKSENRNLDINRYNQLIDRYYS
jgi:hypothetical protein